MIIHKLIRHLLWKIKVIILKITYGNKIQISWSDKIANSVRIRINGSGRVIIGKNVEIREYCILNVTDGGQIVIGDHVFINDGCYINAREQVYIGADTMLGQSVKIYDHDHAYKSDNIKKNFISSPVQINERVWVCSNVIILKNCKIGSDSVIAAGTVVRHNVDSKMLCYTEKVVKNKQISVNN